MAEKDETILIGSILKEERLRLGYTRDQVAERAGIGVRYLVAIENDEKKPKFDVLYRLLRSLGISADKVFYPEQIGIMSEESEHIKRLYQTCTPRDQRLVLSLLDSMLNIQKEKCDK